MKNILGLKPNQDEFAELARKKLVEMEPGCTIAYDREHFSLSVKRADGSFLSLFNMHNAFDEYCAAPRSQKAKVLEAYFQPPVEIPSSLDEALPHVLPRVQRRGFYEGMPLLSKLGDMPVMQEDEADKAELPHAVFAEHYATGLAYDTPHQVLQLSLHRLREWNTDFDSLYLAALKNLEKLTPDPFRLIGPGVYISGYGDTHDATRMLLLDRVKECQVVGRPVVMVPNRNTMIITGESDPAGIKLMLKIVEAALNEPRPMLAIPLVLIDNEWREMHVRTDHPERNQFDHFRALTIADIYASQKDLLESVHAEKEVDIFVASYLAVRNPQTGEVSSFASWTEGVPTLLPKVAMLSLVLVEGENATVFCSVPWEVAEQIVGDMIKPQGMYPERYLVEEFPSEQQLDEMKRASS